MRLYNLRSFALLIVSSVLPLLGCDSGEGEPEPAQGICAQNARVNLSVATGFSDGLPRFTWSPGCRVGVILVEVNGGSDDIWAVTTSGDGFGPMVIYGSTPAGAFVEESASPLVSGTSYDVTVFAVFPENRDMFPIGEATFVAP